MGADAAFCDAAHRMSRKALICVCDLPAEEDLPESDEGYREHMDERTAKAVAEIEDRADCALKFHEAEAGLGAAEPVAVVQVIEAVAVAGGASAAVHQSALFVRWAYRKIARATHGKPTISLGAAEYLAMADLIDRAGSTPRVLGSGDMCSHSPDLTFAGVGEFFVVLATESGLHHYHVSAYGEVHYIGTSPPIRHHRDDSPPYWAGGDPNDD